MCSVPAFFMRYRLRIHARFIGVCSIGRAEMEGDNYSALMESRIDIQGIVR